MSKLNLKYELAETLLFTDKSRIGMKITPMARNTVEIQFGHYRPVVQAAAAEDLRELADVFLEVAELLEGGKKAPEEEQRKRGAGLMQGLGLPTATTGLGCENQASEKTPELEEEKHTIRVMLSTNKNTCQLRGVFSELTAKQVEELRQAIAVMNTTLPWGTCIWTLN